MTRGIKTDEALESVAEIASSLRISVSRVRASLKRLAARGDVKQMGVAFTGGRTSALTSDPRFREADKS